MRPGPIDRTNRELDEQLERKVKPSPKRLELEVMLRHTAVDLLSAARILQDDHSRRHYRDESPNPVQLIAPVWSHWAAQAFEALELLGIDAAAAFSAVRELRPWVGAWSSGGCSIDECGGAP